MIIAEHSPRVIIQEHVEVGGLPHRVGNYYNESLIFNYINEPIYAIDYKNRFVCIQSHPIKIAGNRKIEIRCRFHNGNRKYDDFSNYELTQNKHEIITIPYDVLREQPVFVEELNAVLCFHDQLSITKHPHSKEELDNEINRIKLEIAQSQSSDSPFVLLANDPSGKINTICIEVNGVICETKVTCYSREIDRVILGLRNKPHSLEDFTTYTTTFSELMKQDQRVWTLGGFRLSSSREWFENVLCIERASKPECIEVAAVDSLIKQTRSEYENKIQQLIDDNKEQASKLRKIETLNDELRNGAYNEKSIDLAFKKLAVEQEKLKQSEFEAKLSKDMERLKLKKEIVTTLGVVAKTAAIMIPIGVGIYKAIKATK